jgi:hypothetical protein
MEIFYAICAGIITAAIVYGVWQAVETMKQLRATARAVEYLAINTNEKIEATRGFFEAVDSFSGTVRSFWFKAAHVASAFLSGMRQGR